MPHHKCEALLRLLRLHSSAIFTFLDSHDLIEKVRKKRLSIVKADVIQTGFC